MTLVRVARDAVEIDLLDLEVGDSLVDESLVTFGAGNRDLLLVVQHMGRVAGAHDGGQP